MKARNLHPDDRSRLVAFVQDLVRIPSSSGEEEAVAGRIVEEMEHLGFDDAQIDASGNVIGRIGQNGDATLMLNGHMDTIQVSDVEKWSHDPLGAEIDDQRLFGLGACDMKAGLGAMIYSGLLVKETAADLNGDLVVACVCQEEPCEGMGTRTIIEEDGIEPNWVIVCEPTAMEVTRGHRGRIEMRVVVHGDTCHAACPSQGENAIYRAARLAFGLEILAGQLADDPFLGSGTLAVTDISSRAGSRNAVPDRCELIIDRRLTLGETETKALAEIQRAIAREGAEASVEITEHEALSYTGTAFSFRESVPAWVMPEDHPLVEAMAKAVRTQLKRRPQITRWDFSTEGAYTAAVAGIPTVGFGPGDPIRAHTADEYVEVQEIGDAASVYAQVAIDLLGQR